MRPRIRRAPVAKKVLLPLACAFATAAAAQTVPANQPGWKLAWADEFSQADGTKPSPLNWTYDIGGNGWGNQELETYTARTNNARIQNGMLVIEARREDYTGSDGYVRHYTSARLKTQGKFSTTYGRVEARIQVPRSQGLWPAFWLLGNDVSSVGWPACGEIDIMENIGREPSLVHGTVHGPGYSGGNGISHPYALPSNAPFADTFHVYALEWSPAQIKFIVDNQAYFTVTPASLPAGTKWVFTGPSFLILNVAVGGGWPGSPDASTVLPQKMLVDYVRVYEPISAATPALRVERQTNHVFLQWPETFPQGRIEASRAPAGPWMPEVTDGSRAAGYFFSEIRPGFYRLSLGD